MENNNENAKKDLDSKDGLNDFFSDLGDEDTIDGDYDEIDQMIDEVMALLENYASYSGGLITLATIFDYLKLRNYPDIEEDDCFEIISRLKTNRVIMDEIVATDLPNLNLYVFKDVQISAPGKELIKIFARTPQVTLQQMKDNWTLEESALLTAVEELQQKKMVVVENEFYSIPAIQNKNKN